MKVINNMHNKFLVLMLLLGVALILAACSRRPSSTSDIPRQLPQKYQISVAPFTQPINPAQLISGQIPENQGKISPDVLEALNVELRRILMEDTKRSYNFIPSNKLPKVWRMGHSEGQPGALKYWLEYGREHNAQYLLVPQIMDWHERVGSEAGITSPAHARVEIYLVNVHDNEVMGRSIFEEEQVGLVDNLLTINEFVKRRGRWVSAQELAEDGMRKAVKDLGL